MAYKAVRSNSRKFRTCNERLNQYLQEGWEVVCVNPFLLDGETGYLEYILKEPNSIKDKLQREKVIDFAIAASTLAFHVENLLEEYKCSGKLTDNQLIKMQYRIRVLRDNEEEFKKVLGID